jgi:hypothetical protein
MARVQNERVSRKNFLQFVEAELDHLKVDNGSAPRGKEF